MVQKKGKIRKSNFLRVNVMNSFKGKIEKQKMFMKYLTWLLSKYKKVRKGRGGGIFKKKKIVISNT